MTNQKYFVESGAEELPPERQEFLEELRIREVEEQQKYIQINAKME